MILVARGYKPPPRVTLGRDNVPHYIVAQRGEAHFWEPPEGTHLVITVDGQPIAGAVESDRKRGWVRAAHFVERADGTKELQFDADGSRLFRMYYGKVRYGVFPLPRAARAPIAPNVSRGNGLIVAASAVAIAAIDPGRK